MPKNRYQRNTVVNYGNVPNYEAYAYGQVAQADLSTAKVADDFTALALKSADVIIEQDKQIEGMLAGQGPNPKLKSGAEMFLPGSAAYNKGLAAAYGLEVMAEAKSKVEEFQRPYEVNGEIVNPTAAVFFKKWGAYAKGKLDGIADPRLKVLAQSKLSQYAGPVHKAMQKAEAKQVQGIRQEKLIQLTQVLNADAISAVRSGDETAPDAVRQARAALIDLINSQDPNHQIPPAKGAKMQRDFESGVVEALWSGGLQEILKSGDIEEAYEYIQDFKSQQPSTLGKGYQGKGLTTDEVEKISRNMWADVTAFKKAKDAHNDLVEVKNEMDMDEVSIKLIADLQGKPGSERNNELIRLLESHEIDIPHFKSINSVLDSQTKASSGIQIFELQNSIYKQEGTVLERDQRIMDAVLNGSVLPQDGQALREENRKHETMGATEVAGWGQAVSLLREMHKATEANIYKLNDPELNSYLDDHYRLIDLVEDPKNPMRPIDAARLIYDESKIDTRTLEERRGFNPVVGQMTVKEIMAEFGSIIRSMRGDRLEQERAWNQLNEYLEERRLIEDAGAN